MPFFLPGVEKPNQVQRNTDQLASLLNAEEAEVCAEGIKEGHESKSIEHRNNEDGDKGTWE